MSGRVGPRWRAALACAGWWLTPALVAAQPVASGWHDVQLQLPGCTEPPYDTALLLEHLRLELQLRGFRLRSDGSPAARVRLALALLDCPSAAAELTLEAVDRAQRWRVQRRLSLAEVPLEARPRTLALAIAESLGTARDGPALAARAAQEPAPPEPSPPASSPAEPSPVAIAAAEIAPAEMPAAIPRPAGPLSGPTLQLGLAAQLRTPLFQAAHFWGGELSARAPAGASAGWKAVAWVAEAGFTRNTTATRLGAMQADLWSLALGVELSARDSLHWGFGPRLALAYVAARPARRSQASEAQEGTFMPLFGARARLSLPLGGSWLISSTLDLQHPLRGLVLTAGGEPKLELEGWLVSSGLGLAFQP